MYGNGAGNKLKLMDKVKMKKLKRIVFAAICMSVLLTGCNGDSAFHGNKIADADSFRMEYSVLNQREEAYLLLEAGDSLQVAISQETGTVDVVVAVDGSEPVYEENHISNMDFTLNVNEAGT